ncbi:hypothetical protein CAOG_01807 [Capsaspora owczarzaki ATCC 30864]|uniref:RGS domain-containing protein n=1 Tax=Capsaspora owczarzaki (strain ATCC 30864) TaxID=595528 RepID=A0A0D2VKF5_CAPO3|nr:hypothetical protein CAOG_01807 [Capsaspora owczarzaki ATCC 30864]KJE90497.1 hypothetical protein CAOG_001807 [Capsaspora owczarzaki ATCC 30864]|eukprot:XP_004364675.1 hypothetical protein CAOG_01807 [Capsaspora owczarzaki ATCC 30864]
MSASELSPNPSSSSPRRHGRFAVASASLDDTSVPEQPLDAAVTADQAEAAEASEPAAASLERDSSAGAANLALAADSDAGEQLPLPVSAGTANNGGGGGDGGAGSDEAGGSSEPVPVPPVQGQVQVGELELTPAPEPTPVAVVGEPTAGERASAGNAPDSDRALAASDQVESSTTSATGSSVDANSQRQKPATLRLPGRDQSNAASETVATSMASTTSGSASASATVVPKLVVAERGGGERQPIAHTPGAQLLLDLLHDDEYLFYLVEFMEREGAQTLLAFWLMVESFRQYFVVWSPTEAQLQQEQQLLQQQQQQQPNQSQLEHANDGNPSSLTSSPSSSSALSGSGSLPSRPARQASSTTDPVPPSPRSAADIGPQSAAAAEAANLDVALSIFNKHISARATHPLPGMTDALRTDIEARIHSEHGPDIGCFDAAQSHVLVLMDQQYLEKMRSIAVFATRLQFYGSSPSDTAVAALRAPTSRISVGRNSMLLVDDSTGSISISSNSNSNSNSSVGHSHPGQNGHPSATPSPIRSPAPENKSPLHKSLSWRLKTNPFQQSPPSPSPQSQSQSQLPSVHTPNKSVASTSSNSLPAVVAPAPDAPAAAAAAAPIPTAGVAGGLVAQDPNKQDAAGAARAKPGLETVNEHLTEAPLEQDADAADHDASADTNAAAHLQLQHAQQQHQQYPETPAKLDVHMARGGILGSAARMFGMVDRKVEEQKAAQIARAIIQDVVAATSATAQQLSAYDQPLGSPGGPIARINSRQTSRPVSVILFDDRDAL